MNNDQIRKLFSHPYIGVFGVSEPRCMEGQQVLRREVIPGLYTYVVFAMEDGDRCVCCNLTDRILQIIGMTEQDIFDEAWRNTEETLCRVKKLSECLGDPDVYNHVPLFQDMELYVVQYCHPVCGASVIANQSLLENMRGMFGDMLLIPSSTSEILMIPASALEYERGMDDLVGEVNQTMLTEKERLGDRIYYFDGVL